MVFYTSIRPIQTKTRLKEGFMIVRPNSPYPGPSAESRRISEILECASFAIEGVQKVDLKVAGFYNRIKTNVRLDLDRCSNMLHDAALPNRRDRSILFRSNNIQLNYLYTKLMEARCIGRTVINLVDYNIFAREKNLNCIKFYLLDCEYYLPGQEKDTFKKSITLSSKNKTIKITRIRNRSHESTCALLQIAIEVMLISDADLMVLHYKGTRPNIDNCVKKNGFTLNVSNFRNVAHIQKEDLDKAIVLQEGREGKPWRSIIAESSILFSVKRVDSLYTIASRSFIRSKRTMSNLDFFKRMKPLVPEEVLERLMVEKYRYYKKAIKE